MSFHGFYRRRLLQKKTLYLFVINPWASSTRPPRCTEHFVSLSLLVHLRILEASIRDASFLH